MTTDAPADFSVADLFRGDSPAFNDALRAALAADPCLAADPHRAAALAAELYARHGTVVSEVDETLLRPELLQRVVVGFDALPWMHGDPNEDEFITWGVTAVLDLTGLSRQECELLAALYRDFNFSEDRDLASASFVAFTARQWERPTEQYQAASLRLARDSAERVIIQSPAGQEARLSPSRPFWSRLIDRARVAYG